MDLGLRGKVAIVTGGSSGIGLASAARLADEGVTVMVLGRRADHLADSVKQLEKHGTIESAVLDVADHAAYTKLINDVADRHGRLDIIVNNAANAQFAMIEDMSDETWDSIYQTNIGAVRASVRAGFPIMRKQGGGVYVNITSIMGARAQAMASAYGSSKAAIQQFTDIAALEGAPDKIRLNTIQVGSIVTEGTNEYRENFPEQADLVARTIPLGRWGEPDEIAWAVVFLASDRASFITGACLPIDGALGVAFPY